MSELRLPVDKRRVIESLNFGARIAEEERESLAAYFVETDQWRKVINDQVDIVFGPKGSGKSAIYTSLANRERELGDEGILIISAENPRGATVFRGLVADPPTSEVEFISIWKLYVLTLIGSLISDYGFTGKPAKTVVATLAGEDLLSGVDAPLSVRFRKVWDWIKSVVGRTVSETSVHLDPSLNVSAVTWKISLQEPSATESRAGTLSIDELLEKANQALAENEFSTWILFDRLDVAFAESHQLEANGLRALFKAYLDIASLDCIRLKIFLRSDIWSEITAGGFREASHITRDLRIEWGSDALLNLVVRRSLKNPAVVEFYGDDPARVLLDSNEQRAFFDRMVPDQVDVGKNPRTFEWILGRVQDGTKVSAPREVIHLLNEARDAQQRMLERGEPEPYGMELLSRAAFREAQLPVSKVRLEQTYYAEYPKERTWVESLEGEKTEYTVDALAELWGVARPETVARAQRLVDTGFLERRADRGTYWVPFLYRPALRLRQGSA